MGWRGIRKPAPRIAIYPRFFPPGLPPGLDPPGLGPLDRPPAGFRAPPDLPLKPGPDFEKPPGLAPKAGLERPSDESRPVPPALGFHAGFPGEVAAARLLLGRAPPGRGLPLLVVKGRDPAARGGRPAPNSLAPVRPGPPDGRVLLVRSNVGRSKRGRSDTGRSGLGRLGLGLSCPG